MAEDDLPAGSGPIDNLAHDPANGQTAEQDAEERGPARAAPRVSLFLLAPLTSEDGRFVCKARIRNLSASGLMADCDGGVAKGMRLRMELRGVGPVVGSVAWVKDGRLGISFENPIDPQLARVPVGQPGSGKSMPEYLRPLPRRLP